MDGVAPLAKGFVTQLILGGSGHAGSLERCRDRVWERNGDDLRAAAAFATRGWAVTPICSQAAFR